MHKHVCASRCVCVSFGMQSHICARLLSHIYVWRQIVRDRDRVADDLGEGGWRGETESVKKDTVDRQMSWPQASPDDSWTEARLEIIAIIKQGCGIPL